MGGSMERRPPILLRRFLEDAKKTYADCRGPEAAPFMIEGEAKLPSSRFCYLSVFLFLLCVTHVADISEKKAGTENNDNAI